MGAETRTTLFNKDMFLRIKTQEILRILGPADGKTCLDIGLDNGVVSGILRKHGGSWQTVARKPAAMEHAAAALGTNVVAFDGARLPFEDKSFDVAILSDFIEYLPSEHELIAECHRILKPSGRLILNVPHAKRWSFVNMLESMFGQTAGKKAMARRGYTETDLFQLLKHGFDVHIIRSYSRTPIQTIRYILEKKAATRGNDSGALLKLYSSFYILYWLAFQFDAFFFFTKGYYLVADAFRHPWRPRETPILNDGRSISEAVLSKIRK